MGTKLLLPLLLLQLLLHTIVRLPVTSFNASVDHCTPPVLTFILCQPQSWMYCRAKSFDGVFRFWRFARLGTTPTLSSSVDCVHLASPLSNAQDLGCPPLPSVSITVASPSLPSKGFASPPWTSARRRRRSRSSPLAPLSRNHPVSSSPSTAL